MATYTIPYNTAVFDNSAAGLYILLNEDEDTPRAALPVQYIKSVLVQPSAATGGARLRFKIDADEYVVSGTFDAIELATEALALFEASETPPPETP